MLCNIASRFNRLSAIALFPVLTASSSLEGRGVSKKWVIEVLIRTTPMDYENAINIIIAKCEGVPGHTSAYSI